MSCNTTSDENVTARWVPSVNDIPDKAWDELFGANVVKRKEFFIAAENSGFDGVEITYLVVSLEGRILSVVPCFLYTIDLINLVSAKGPSSFFKKIRKVFPNLMKVRSFMTGTYPASCEPFITMLPGMPETVRAKVRRVIEEELKGEHRRRKSGFIFVKDARENSIEEVRDVLPDDFTYIVSFPTSLIPVLPDFPYPSALRTKSKQRVRNIEKKFDERFRWEVVTDFAALNHDYFIRYRNVLEKAANKFEFLNEKFFAEINRLYGESSFLMVASDRQSGEIRLMTLILEDETRLVPLYLGITYKDDDTRVLYLANIFRIVREAEKRGKKIIEFGQTSYYPKSLSGALVENVYYGFWSDRPVYKFLIRHLFGKIFAPPAIPGDAYRSSAVAKVMERFAECSIIPRKQL